MAGPDEKPGLRITITHPDAAATASQIVPPAFDIAEDVVSKYGDKIPKGGLLPNDLSGLKALGKQAYHLRG